MTGRERTEGPVDGRALRGEYVHHAGLGLVFFVRGSEGGLYDLKTIGRDDYVTADLTGPEWTFHPQPDTVLMTTSDPYGNTRTWRLSGIPAFATEELNTRRALKRHWLVYGVVNDLVTVDPDWHWTSRARG